MIGLFQAVAMIPGVSRSAATIIGGLILGISRKTIVEFSFLLSVPTMVAATGLDMIKSGGQFSSEEFHILFIGFITSFIIALLSIKWLIHFIKNHTFLSFGIYRILISLLFWFMIL
jgi:undecaprenyl-diphosphatase